MGNFFAGSWVPKLGAAISAAGIGLAAVNPFWGFILGQVGSAVVGMSARQNNKSSEAIGIVTPQIVTIVKPPTVIVEQPLMPSERDTLK